MIRRLTIHNIALIESASVQFKPGLTVLSGETGAGKSIIIDAAALILGGRADKNLIRSGCEKASVEVEFEVDPQSDIPQILERESIDSAGDSIVLFREVSRNGRNVCRINGVLVSANILKDVSAFLLNLHGQSEHQFLADESRHLSYLDLMGGESLQKLKDKVREAYDLFIANHRSYAKLIRMNEGKERRADQLRYELDEMHKADVKPGEEERLSEEARHLNKASRIHEKVRNAYQLIGDGEDGTDSMHSLQRAAKELRTLSAEDPEFDMTAEQCEKLSYSLEDILYKLNHLVRKYDFNAAALETAENRLESIRKLLRKYGPTEADVIENMEKMEEEYQTLSGIDALIEKTGAEHKKLLAGYRSAARQLTAERKQTAERFEEQMMRELKDLGMENTIVKVQFEENSSGKPLMPTPDGDDRVCFMISPNPGEPLKPMAKIASGGELSRLMLAVKTIESGRSGLQTMIFDEIDTGISGRMAQAVAEKMVSIASRQQVICISHLPQIAASADYQYLVYKGVKNDRTYTEVRELTRDQRREEIGRMISGAQGISEDAAAYAGKMMDASEKGKERIRKSSQAPGRS